MMNITDLPVSTVTVTLSRTDLRRMLSLVRLLYRLSQSDHYRQLVALQLPEVARFDPGHDGLMMGYDFHLTADGPRLIEVNTNAGGAFLAWLAAARRDGLNALDTTPLQPRMRARLLDSVRREWQGFCAGSRPLQRVAIVDEDPQQQPLYAEMCVFRDGLQQAGLAVEILTPQQCEVREDGIYGRGERIDLIYNRHCDFFLEDPPLAAIRTAYEQRTVCLSPNPFVYGLLADKRRMVLWSDAEQLCDLPLSTAQIDLLLKLVPRSRLLADCDPQQVWAQRKKLVLKPVSRFGSRGVLMGKSMSRHRFSEQDPQTTLVQQMAPPGVTEGDGESFKTDLRLYVYRDRLLGIGARLYQGQVTNLRTVGGGFAPVALV